jgi:plasmid stability protein
MVSMRTTLTLDDQLAKALKSAAHRSGKPFKEVVNETLRAGLAAERTRGKPRPYRLKPASLGGVRPGFDLDKALRLADALEDEEIARELAQRK